MVAKNLFNECCNGNNNNLTTISCIVFVFFKNVLKSNFHAHFRKTPHVFCFISYGCLPSHLHRAPKKVFRCLNNSSYGFYDIHTLL